MKPKYIILSLLLSFSLVCAAAGPSRIEKKTIPFESLKKYITCELFDPNFLLGDCNYHCLISASDGKIYFSLGTHNTDYACHFYSFDPATGKITLIAELDKVLGEDAKKELSQGKIHTRLFEHKGKIWFATHSSFYNWKESVPGTDYGCKIPYKGGHFMNYDLKTGKFTDIARIFPGEGIITMTVDRTSDILYGLTWPAGIFVSYDIKTSNLRYWGAAQGRGEWGNHPSEWNRICRTLAIDPNGYVYGSTMDGRIWKYDRTKPRPISYIQGLDLSGVPFSQSAEDTNKGDFQNIWRTIEWNPNTNSFWGLHTQCTTLFEFDPAANYIRAVAELRHEAYFGMPKNPEKTQLGFMIGPKNTIFYLAHSPAVVIKGREPVQSALNLITYEIDKNKYTDHGPILSKDKRRVFFAESIAIGPDDHIYTVAWVEGADPQRREFLKSIRVVATAAETEETPYEMMLVRLPKWQEFIK